MEWSFLETIMRKLGFNKNWITHMMAWVSIVSYSILIHGAPTGFIRPTRGKRQGDSLSSFMFLLCTKGLHGLLTQLALRGDIHGFSLRRISPSPWTQRNCWELPPSFYNDLGTIYIAFSRERTINLITRDMGLELRYSLRKMLGTQNRPILRLASPHCVLCLNPIKDTQYCYSRLSHAR